mgnify:CR=1 FL=1
MQFFKSELAKILQSPEYNINDYYTDISANVTSLEIEIDKPKDAQLTGVVCSNNVEINKYRILFFVMAFSMLYLAVFE